MYLNFIIIKAVVNIFAESLHAGRATIDMKHIKGILVRMTGSDPLGWT